MKRLGFVFLTAIFGLGVLTACQQEAPKPPAAPAEQMAPAPTEAAPAAPAEQMAPPPAAPAEPAPAEPAPAGK